jgi:cell wall-associated NlpC family hydrolase
MVKAPTFPGPSVTGQAIADDALRYEGQGYVYGGNASRPGDWDCSSFISYVLGHDLGLPLPGGMWGGPGMPPNDHGPVVMDYVNWSLASPVPMGMEEPGDLVCWPGYGPAGHIGIVTGINEMVSALNPQIGTRQTPIAGYGPGPVWVYRRVTAAGPVTLPQPAGPTAAQIAAAVLLGLAVAVAAAAAVILAGIGAGAAGIWLAGKAVR